METQEAKKKNQETLKLLKKEKKNLQAIKKSINELEDSLNKESDRLDNKIRGLAHKYDYYYVVRIGDIAYDFHYSSREFTHALRQNERNQFDLYDVTEQIIAPSKKKSHLGFKVGDQIRLKQEGFIPFRYDGSWGKFYFPAGVDIVERGGSHYVLGVSPPEEVKNPIVRTTIECFYVDGKALVRYYTTRNYYNYFEVVELSNYESCSHLEWDSKKGSSESFAKYLETNGLTGKIEFEDKFGFRVGESIYLKSHEKIILKNPVISSEKFERALGKDLYFMQSFIVRHKTVEPTGNCDWKVFGFVGDKVLVKCNQYGKYSHFELLSPEEIGLIIDLDYRLKKEKYFDRLILDYNLSGPIIRGIAKKK